MTQIEYVTRLLALPEHPAPQCGGPTVYVPPQDFFQVEGRLFSAHLVERVYQLARTRVQKYGMLWGITKSILDQHLSYGIGSFSRE